MRNPLELNRREFMQALGGVAGAAAASKLINVELAEAAETEHLPWENGKYQTFPRLYVPKGRKEQMVLQNIDLGTLGPDVDTVFGLDFQGDLKTDALVVHMPEGKVLETRVVGIKRADLETVQMRGVLGGDRFDVYQISKFGGDKALDEMARLHATNTARKHQKVVYIGDLGLFEKDWGSKEMPLLKRIIRAQRPAKPELGIEEPDFVNPRQFTPKDK